MTLLQVGLDDKYRLEAKRIYPILARSAPARAEGLAGGEAPAQRPYGCCLTFVGRSNLQSTDGGTYTSSRRPKYPFMYSPTRASNEMVSPSRSMVAHCPAVIHTWSVSGCPVLSSTHRAAAMS